MKPGIYTPEAALAALDADRAAAAAAYEDRITALEAEVERLRQAEPDAVTIWATRGYWTRDRSAHFVLPVAKREGRKPFYDPVEVQKAEWHTRRRGRREVRPAFPVAA